MFRAFALPIIAFAGIAFAAISVVEQHQTPVQPQPIVKPPVSPYPHTLAGSGLVEACSENIAVGTPISGVVAEVFVTIGERVNKGARLFRLDDRAVRAEMAVRKAQLAQAKANLTLLASQPRPEELPPVEAKVRSVKVMLADAEDRLERAKDLKNKDAVSMDEWKHRNFAAEGAREDLAHAEAQLKLLKAGAWGPAIDVAKAQVSAAEAQLDAAEVELSRLTVNALADGTVLQVGIRPGEFANAGPPAMGVPPPMLLGDTDVLHVRVDIDENDASNFRPGATAVASLRNRPDVQFPLEYVRRETYVKPKKSLSGENSERVDTRVLQVVYRFQAKDLPVFVGQQVDVFIQAGK